MPSKFVFCTYIQIPCAKDFLFWKIASFGHACLLKLKSFISIFQNFDLMCRATTFQKSFRISPNGWFLPLNDFLELTSMFDSFVRCKILFHVSTRAIEHRITHKSCVDNIQFFQKQLFLKKTQEFSLWNFIKQFWNFIKSQKARLPYVAILIVNSVTSFFDRVPLIVPQTLEKNFLSSFTFQLQAFSM